MGVKRRTCLRAPVFAAAIFLSGCAGGPEKEPVLGEAFIGPATLQLREELVARAQMTAKLSHGERVEIIGRRRRFLKLRAPDGSEGWADSRQLLSKVDMDALRSLAGRARQEPGQGHATTFEDLNAHTAPNRQAPSFFKITASSGVEVVTHQKAPRVPFDPPSFLTELSTAKKKSEKPRPKQPKKKGEAQISPPPPGKPPALPDDWIARSGYADGPPSRLLPRPKVETAPAPPPMDWWSLVRTKEGLAGWALTRMLYLAIPEEVAQYAERARIMSYHQLGIVRSRTKGDKPIWLWTTLRDSGGEHHFDGLRVFTWNSRRERYETAYIERETRGWLPVVVERDSGGAATGWKVVVEEKEGAIVRRSYSWNGSRVRIVERTGVQRPQPWYNTPGARSVEAEEDVPEEEPETNPGWRQRVGNWFGDLVSRIRR